MEDDRCASPSETGCLLALARCRQKTSARVQSTAALIKLLSVVNTKCVGRQGCKSQLAGVQCVPNTPPPGLQRAVSIVALPALCNTLPVMTYDSIRNTLIEILSMTLASVCNSLMLHLHLHAVSSPRRLPEPARIDSTLLRRMVDVHSAWLLWPRDGYACVGQEIRHTNGGRGRAKNRPRHPHTLEPHLRPALSSDSARDWLEDITRSERALQSASLSGNLREQDRTLPKGPEPARCLRSVLCEKPVSLQPWRDPMRLAAQQPPLQGLGQGRCIIGQADGSRDAAAALETTYWNSRAAAIAHDGAHNPKSWRVDGGVS